MKILLDNAITIFFHISMMIFISYSFLPAQINQEYTMEYFNEDHPLSQNYVMDLHQDKTGFLWIATRDGLDRYDGYNVKSFRYSNKDTTSICGNFIECICEDSKGYLWFGTYEGFSKYEPKTETFLNYTKDLTDSISLRNKSVLHISEDDNGIIWLGTTKGLYTFNPKSNKFKCYLMDVGNPRALQFENNDILYKDRDGNIWISPGHDYISFYDKKNDNFINITSQQYPFLKNTLRSFVDDGQGFIYINTMKNFIYRINKKDKTVSDITNVFSPTDIYCFLAKCDNDLYLLDGKIISKINSKTLTKKTIIGNEFSYPVSFSLTKIEKTKEGILWVGTNGQGLYKFVPRMTKFQTIKYNKEEANKLSVRSVRSIYYDSNDNLWIGGYTTLNVIHNFKLQLKQKRADQLNIEVVKALDKNNVYSIIEDPFDPNVLWIGTEFYSLYKFNKRTQEIITVEELPWTKKFLNANRFYKFLIDQNKNLWVGTNTGLFKLNLKQTQITSFINNPDDKSSIAKGKVWTLLEDSNGLIWLGTNLGGVSVINTQTSLVKRYETVEGDLNSICSNYIQALHEDKDKNIWIATKSGLSFFDRTSNKFINYTEKDGLANDCVYSVIEDDNNNLWLSTNKGITKFDVNNKKYNNYDVSFGLQNNEFNSAAYFKDKDGMIYFGGISGLTFFNPNEIKQNEYIPNFGLINFQKLNTDVELDTSITFTKNLNLLYNDYSFSFEFTSFDFSYPEKNEFAYMLEGFDKDWITTTADKRYAVYTNVEPGNYTFKLKASNSDGIWNDKYSSINISIAPPYWETWWFKLSLSILILGTGYSLYRSRINRLREEKTIQQDLTKKLINNQEEERKYISGELHDSLGQSLLVVKNNLMLAQRDKNYDDQIENSLELLSQSISEVSNISHFLHPSELDQLGLVLAVGEMTERIERASDLTIDCDIYSVENYFPKEKEIIIFRIIQEALNNILKHARATKVDINTETGNGRLKIFIKDNGVGFITDKQNLKSNRPHFGLAGMKERVNMLNGKFEITSEINKGTEILLIFNPILK